MNALWQEQFTTLSPRVRQSRVFRAASPLTCGEVIAAWQDDGAFCTWFNQSLAEVPFAAFRWETPPLITTNLNRPFEYVVIDSPSLVTRPDRESFAGQFRRASAGQTVVTFANLGKDATLVAPCPVAGDECYAHLGDFVRDAPEAQRSELWQRVGEALAARVNEQPVWLSTAGAGVAWLHVRLDDRPKYYHHGPYREGR